MTISMRNLTHNADDYKEWNPIISVSFSHSIYQIGLSVTFSSNEPDDSDSWPDVNEDKGKSVLSELTSIFKKNKKFNHAKLEFYQSQFATIHADTPYNFLPCWRFYEDSAKIHSDESPTSELGYGWGTQLSVYFKNGSQLIRKDTVLSIIKEIMLYNGFKADDDVVTLLNKNIEERKSFSFYLNDITKK